MGLYDPAFAALTRLYGRDARAPITGITLIAGFASTIGWPLSALVRLHAFRLARGLPDLGRAQPVRRDAAQLVRSRRRRAARRRRGASGRRRSSRTAARRDADPRLLLLRDALCQRRDVGASAAAAARAPARPRSRRSPPRALVGPAQVAARLVEFGLLRACPPADLGADRGAAASARRGLPRRARAGRRSLRSRCCTAPATA